MDLWKYFRDHPLIIRKNSVAEFSLEGIQDIGQITLRQNDGITDIFVHHQEGKYWVYLEKEGKFSKSPTGMGEGELAVYLQSRLIDNQDPIRLLSCSDLASAQKLSKHLEGRNIYATDDIVAVHTDGGITTVARSGNDTQKWRKLKNGKDIGETPKPKEPQGEAVEEFVSMGIFDFLKGKAFNSIYDVVESHPTIKRFKKEILRNGGKVTNELSIEEEAIIKFYTTNIGYKKLNQALRAQNLNNFQKAVTKYLNEALDKLPRYSSKDDEWFYRIVNYTDDIRKKYKMGEEIIEKHFFGVHKTLGALEESSLRRNHNTVIKVQGKNGRLIEDLSKLKTEQEVLFKSGTKFKVKLIQMEKHPNKLIPQPIEVIYLIEK